MLIFSRGPATVDVALVDVGGLIIRNHLPSGRMSYGVPESAVRECVAARTPTDFPGDQWVSTHSLIVVARLLILRP